MMKKSKWSVWQCLQRGWLVAVIVMLTACASSYNAPVQNAETGLPADASRLPNETPDLQGRPLLPGETIGGEALSAKRSTPPVVGKLLRQSEQAGAEQDWVRAETYLQRALRITPKNAVLWSRMAEVKLKQGKTAQAIQFASKSNAISKEVNLRQRNQAIISAAQK